MSAVGRNQPGHGANKQSDESRRSCAAPSGSPDDIERAQGLLAAQGREAAVRLILLSEDERLDLFDEMIGLPGRHPSLQFPLPEALAPDFDVDALRDTIEDDPDAASERLAAALERLDTPLQRARLAGAVLALAATGEVRPAVADAALLDLDCHPTSAMLCTSLLHSLSLTAGVRGTRARLLVASR